ncbi:MAG TPA: hypothetical protein VLS51_06675 [Propionibacteriaceae bacterium]|nr:hypothetical protein [Propionibacteriaceae bacterium]
MSDEAQVPDLDDGFEVPMIRTWAKPPEGWSWYGSHSTEPVDLEFSIALGEDGLPLFERPVGGGDHAG